MAIDFITDCLERASTNALDLGINGSDQRGHGNLNSLCVGAL